MLDKKGGLRQIVFFSNVLSNASSNHESNGITAAGFPSNGLLANASTLYSGNFI
jgi:hypothetical protein